MYSNYLYYSSSTSYSKFNESRSFSGYVDSLFKVVEFSGTWKEYSLPSDGFDDVTKGYYLDFTSTKTTYYSIERITDYQVAYYSSYYGGESTYSSTSKTYRFTAAYDASKTIIYESTDIIKPLRVSFEATNLENVVLLDGEYFSIQ